MLSFVDLGFPSVEPGWRDEPAFVAAALVQQALFLEESGHGRSFRNSTPEKIAYVVAYDEANEAKIMAALEAREAAFQAPFTFASTPTVFKHLATLHSGQTSDPFPLSSETPEAAAPLMLVKNLGPMPVEQRLVHDEAHYQRLGIVVNQIPSGFGNGLN